MLSGSSSGAQRIPEDDGLGGRGGERSHCVEDPSPQDQRIRMHLPAADLRADAAQQLLPPPSLARSLSESIDLRAHLLRICARMRLSSTFLPRPSPAPSQDL